MVNSTYPFDPCSLNIGSFWQQCNIKADTTSQEKSFRSQTLASAPLHCKILLSILKLISSVPLKIDFV